jgi:hypothetical protein
MVLKAKVQALELRQALAHICEQVSENLANDGVYQDRMNSPNGTLDAL